MASLFSSIKQVRKNYAKIHRSIEIPDLIELQKKSYMDFLQMDVEPSKRKMQGLQTAFHSVFPIEDFNKTATLEFDSYVLEAPKYDVRECCKRGMTFAGPLKITFRYFV